MRLDELPTPTLLVDSRRLESNLRTMQTRADREGVALRPHTKTHKSIALAKRQLELGAKALTVAKPSEAVVYAAAGLSDLRIAYPLVGPHRLEAVKALLEQGHSISFCVDSEHGAHLASDAFSSAELAPDVLLKVDCGYGRAGVRWDSDDPIALARCVRELPGLTLRGLLTHSGQAYHGPKENETKAEALERVARHECHTMISLAERLAGEDLAEAESFELSVGSTPAMSAFRNESGSAFSVTEVRAGNYAFYDRTQLDLGACNLEDCALTVLATVVSARQTPEGHHLLLDAGRKVLTSDRRAGQKDYGLLLRDAAEHHPIPWTSISGLSEEHGWVSWRGDEEPPRIGDRLRVLPNHACVVVNLADQFHVHDGERVLDTWRVDARGKVL